jgi:nucleoid-associated protein YgaU
MPTIAAPAMPAKTVPMTRSVTLRPGQSLWTVALQNLGRGSRWQELLTANPRIGDPTRIAAGTEIVLPSTVTGLKSDLKVTVTEGDSLSKIAKATYGQVAAWRCIAQANPQIADANKIFAGQQLLLPLTCGQ